MTTHKHSEIPWAQRLGPLPKDEAKPLDAGRTLSRPWGKLDKLGFESRERAGRFYVTDRRTGDRVTKKGMTPEELLEWAASVGTPRTDTA